MFKVVDSFNVPVQVITKETPKHKGSKKYSFAVCDIPEHADDYKRLIEDRQEFLSQDKLYDFPYDPYVEKIEEYCPKIIDGHTVLKDYYIHSSLLFVDMFYPDFMEQNNLNKWGEDYTVLGNVSEDGQSVHMDILKPMVDMSYLYMFQCGVGQDGGFGDYSNPYWSEPLTLDNTPIVMLDIEQAGQVVEELNELASQDFYNNNDVDAYSGEFPMEYQLLAIPLSPGVSPSYVIWEKDHVMNTIKEMHQKEWKSPRNY